jgi:hypothetical protein
MDGNDLALRCDQSKDDETKELVKTWLFENPEDWLVPHLFGRLIELESNKAALQKWVDKWLKAKKRRTHWSIIAVAEQFPTQRYLDYAHDDFKHGLHLPWSNRLLINLLRDHPSAATIESAEDWIKGNGCFRESKIVCELLKELGSPVVLEETLGDLNEDKLQLVQAILLAFPTERLIKASEVYLKKAPRTALNALFLQFLIKNKIIPAPENLIDAWMIDWPGRRVKRELLVHIACEYIRNYPNTEYSLVVQDKIMKLVERRRDSTTLHWLIIVGIFTPRTSNTIKDFILDFPPKERGRILVRLYASAEEDDSFDVIFDNELHRVTGRCIDSAPNSLLTTLMATAFPERYLPKLRALPPDTNFLPEALLLMPEKWNEQVATRIEASVLERTRYHPWARIDRAVPRELIMIELLMRQENPSEHALELAKNCLHNFLPNYEEFLSPYHAKQIRDRRPRVEKLLRKHLNQ